MSDGFFGSLFDFNGDGELDVFEQSFEFFVFNEVMKSNQNKGLYSDDDDDN